MSFGVIGDDLAPEADRLVGDHVQPGDTAFAGKLFPVGSGVDGADWDHEAHLVDRGDHPPPEVWESPIAEHCGVASSLPTCSRLWLFGIMIRSRGAVSRLGPVANRDGRHR